MNQAQRHLERLLPLLVCPSCRGELTANKEGLVCAPCRVLYPVIKGVPRMAPEEAVRLKG